MMYKTSIAEVIELFDVLTGREAVLDSDIFLLAGKAFGKTEMEWWMDEAENEREYTVSQSDAIRHLEHLQHVAWHHSFSASTSDQGVEKATYTFSAYDTTSTMYHKTQRYVVLWKASLEALAIAKYNYHSHT